MNPSFFALLEIVKRITLRKQTIVCAVELFGIRRDTLLRFVYSFGRDAYS